MARDKVKRKGDGDLFYLDALLNRDRTLEEIEKEIQWLKEESDKLTEWPKT